MQGAAVAHAAPAPAPVAVSSPPSVGGGRASVAAFLLRLFDDESFRWSLIRAGDDQLRRARIRNAGYGPFTVSDVRAEVGALLRTGRRPLSTEPVWAPGPTETQSDAPPCVLESKRRALVFGALAATACVDAGTQPICPRLPVRVGYVVVGALKGGTTAIDYFLSQHPEICTASQKETHFFIRDIFFRGAEPEYEWLDFSFPHYRGERLVGEATPEYLYSARVAARMRAYNPDMKLVLLLRDPAERAYSQYRMAVNRGHETRSLTTALQEDMAAEGGVEGTYTAGGFYLRYVRELLRHFPASQLLFLRSENLLRHHRRTLDEVYRFLGVDPVTPQPREVLVGTGPRLPPADRAALIQLYRAEIEALERFLDWDLADWTR